MLYKYGVIQIHSNNSLIELFKKYPIDNIKRITELFNGDEFNVNLAIEIYKTVYPDIDIEDKRNNDYEWTIVGAQVKDPSRTATLKPSTI